MINTRRVAQAAGGRGSPGTGDKGDKGEKIKGGGEKTDTGKDNKTNTGKQGTLDNIVKKVTFEDERLRDFKKKVTEDLKSSEELRARFAEELKKIRLEKIEVEKLKIEVEARENAVSNRLDSLEKQLEILVERDKDREARVVELEERCEKWAREGDCDSSVEISSCGSKASGVSRLTSRSAARSVVSGTGSVCLSEREVTGMKRMLYEQDRKSRLENFIIKGVMVSEVNKDRIKEWVHDFIMEWLGIDFKVVQARVSGNVIVVKVENVEVKNEIMKKKNKLAGSRYYIEYDLSFEDRKKQEEIHKWVKEMREKGFEVKSGAKRVLINNVWVQWENKEKLQEMIEIVERKKKEKSSVGKGEKRENVENLV